MGEGTTIPWTDNTFSPWWGCTEVSPGCDHCYARQLAARTRGMAWGRGTPRVPVGDATWKQPLKWNERAAAEGRRARVFSASMSDVFDGEVPGAWRERLWALIRATPHLDWQLLTKRAANIARMLPPDWGRHGYGNVWLGVSAETQEHLEQRVPALLKVPARCHFVSYEPALGPIDIWASWVRENDLGGTLDWIIIGGESGPSARLFNPDWARSVLRQCREFNSDGYGPAPFVKQLGSAWAAERRKRYGPGDAKGETPAEWPMDLRIRRHPPTCASCARALPGPDYDYCPSCEES